MLLAEYVNKLLIKYPNQRIISFEFEHKSYIIKQAEQTKGIMRWLKGSPQKAFEREVARLKTLVAQKAPIPTVHLLNERYILMEDGGQSVRNLLKSDLNAEQKQQILIDATKALTELHAQNITHGRPYLKDILWKEGKITFIDFEVSSHSNNLTYQKIRDNLLFIYGLGCEKVDYSQIKTLITLLAKRENYEIWQQTLAFVKKYRFIYFLLLPFKPVAKKDLKGIYVLFETLSSKNH